MQCQKMGGNARSPILKYYRPSSWDKCDNFLYFACKKKNEMVYSTSSLENVFYFYCKMSAIAGKSPAFTMLLRSTKVFASKCT